MTVQPPTPNGPTEPTRFDLRTGLPVLRDRYVTLRELRSDDASALLAHVSTPEVVQHIAAAPMSVDGFKVFIRWTHKQRRRRVHAAFGLVPAGALEPVGLLQFWPVETDFSTAEWGFVVGRQYWGTGLFGHGARLLLDFAFNDMGVLRMETRCAAVNERGNGALRKLGATREGTLRDAFRKGDRVGDHVMWSILKTDRRQTLHGDRGDQ